MNEQNSKQQENKTKKQFGEIYDKNYKFLLIIPLLLLILSLAYIGYFYNKNGDFIKKDVSLTGGTTITLFPKEKINIENLRQSLSEKVQDFSIRELSDFRTGRQEAVVIESSIESSELKQILEGILEYELTEDNSTIEFTGSGLSQSFYKQLQIAIIISFILMAIIVFILFRTLTPSIAVILSAFADIMMTLALVNLLGIRVSSAGIMAFLMLIGYSVDTDIMLTTRLLQRKNLEVNKRILKALKTGLTMTLTSIIAIGIALIITQSFSQVLQQIFIILLIGLSFDILNTWITNVSILKWHLERRDKE